MRFKLYMKYVRYCVFVLAIAASAGDVQWVREYLGNGEWGMAQWKGRGDLIPKKEDPSTMVLSGWNRNGWHRRQSLLEIPYHKITRLEYRHYVTPKQGTTQAVTTANTSLADGIAADLTNAIINAPTETKWLTIFWTDEQGAERGALFELVTSFNRNGKMLQDLETRTGLKIRQMP